MDKFIEYKGYCGTGSYSETDDILYGKIMGINSLISYEGRNIEELTEDFHQSVDECIAFCAEKGIFDP